MFTAGAPADGALNSLGMFDHAGALHFEVRANGSLMQDHGMTLRGGWCEPKP